VELKLYLYLFLTRLDIDFVTIFIIMSFDSTRALAIQHWEYAKRETKVHCELSVAGLNFFVQKLLSDNQHGSLFVVAWNMSEILANRVWIMCAPGRDWEIRDRFFEGKTVSDIVLSLSDIQTAWSYVAE
jgi:hypothetical protein